MTGLFFEYIFAECWFGPALAIIQSNLAPNVRGTGIGIYLFFGTMIGNAGPAVMVYFDDHVSDPSSNLRNVIMGAVIFSYVGCAIVFMITSCMIPGSAEDAQEQQSLLDEEADAFVETEVDL
jgi:Na+/phosphate symporter